MRRYGILAGLLTALVAGDAAVAYGEASVGQAAPDFSLQSVAGETVKLSESKGKYVVLEWTNYDCPFVKKHYGTHNMQQLQKKYTDQGVVWLSICSSAPGKQGHYPPEKWRQMIKDRDASPTAVLLDPEGKVGRLYGAKTTPHMFVVDPDGVLIYKGAIDDNNSWDPKTVQGARNYVDEALSNALSGKKVAKASTRSYGCSVKY